jgi:hypothetical protein
LAPLVDEKLEGLAIQDETSIILRLHYIILHLICPSMQIKQTDVKHTGFEKLTDGVFL